MRKRNRKMRAKVVNPNPIQMALLGKTIMSEDAARLRTRAFYEAAERIISAAESKDCWRKLFDAVNLVEALLVVRRVTGDKVHESREMVDRFHDRILELAERRDADPATPASPSEQTAIRQAVEVLHELLMAVPFSLIYQAECYVARRVSDALRNKDVPAGASFIRGSRFENLPMSAILEELPEEKHAMPAMNSA